MIERVCQRCEFSQKPDVRECEQCGLSFREQLPARRSAPLARQQQKLSQLARRAAKPVALGLAAAALELGAALIQRHTQRSEPAPLTPKEQPKRSTLVRQRVWEEYEQGQLKRRVVEQLIRKDER